MPRDRLRRLPEEGEEEAAVSYAAMAKDEEVLSAGIFKLLCLASFLLLK